MQLNAAQLSLKRPRSSSRLSSEGSPIGRRPNLFKEYMRYFSERLQQLQTTFLSMYQADSSGEDRRTCSERATPEEFQRALWGLLSQLRPFLFLCFPSKLTADAIGEDHDSSGAVQGTEMPDSADATAVAAVVHMSVDEIRKRFRTEDDQRDLQHVLMAHRIYTIAARLTKLSPALSLHCFLTLLSLMPKLADPAVAREEHTHRYLSTMESLLTFLRAWDTDVFCSLVHMLSAPEGLGVFLSLEPEPTTRSLPSRKIRLLPDEASLAHLTRLLAQTSDGTVQPASGEAQSAVAKLFRSTLTPQSTHETVTAAFGVWHLLAVISREPHTVFTAAGVDVSFLVRSACEVLSIHVKDVASSTGGGDRGEQGAAMRASRTSNGHGAPPSAYAPQRRSFALLDSGDAAVTTRKLHDVAGECLANLAEKQRLLPDVDGPQVLSSVVSVLFCAHQHGCLAEATDGWPLRLLQWVVARVGAERDTGGAASWLAAAIFADGGDLLDRMLFSICKFIATGSRSIHGERDACTEGGAGSAGSVFAGSRSENVERVCLDVANALIGLLQHAVATHPTRSTVATRMILAMNTTGITPQWLPALLSLRLPASHWLRRHVSPGAATMSELAVAALPSQLLALLPALFSLLPTTAVWPALRQARRAVQRTGNAAVCSFMDASTLAIHEATDGELTDAGLPLAQKAESGRGGDLVSVPGCMEAATQALKAKGCSEESLGLLIEAFARLFLLQLAPAAAVEESTVTVLDSQESNHLFTREKAAVTVLRSVEDYCVAHKAAVQAVPGELWALFFATVVRRLPVTQPARTENSDEEVTEAEEDRAALHVFRRACLVPKATNSDMLTFAARLGGIACGARRRLAEYLSAVVTTHGKAIADIDRRSRIACQDSRAEGEREVSASLRAALRALTVLAEEVLLVSRSFLSVVKFAAHGGQDTGCGDDTTDHRVFAEEGVVQFLFKQMALLQRTLFDTVMILSTVKGGWQPRAADWQRNAPAVVAAERPGQVVVDVDDDSGAEEVAPAMAQEAPKGGEARGVAETRTTADSDTTTMRSGGSLLGNGDDAVGQSVLDRIVHSHGQILAALATLLGNGVSLSSSLTATVHRVMCTCLMISPRSRDVDRLFFTEVIANENPVIHGSYASLAILRLITERRSPFSFIEASREFYASPSCEGKTGAAPDNCLSWDAVASLSTVSCEGSPADAESARVGRFLAILDAIAAAFRHSCVDGLRGTDWCEQDDMTAIHSAQEVQRMVRIAEGPLGAAAGVLKEGERVLQCLRRLSDDVNLPIPVRATVTDVAVAVLERLHWSPEDLCRHLPTLAASQLFLDVCLHFRVDCRAVVKRSIDVMGPPLLFGNDATHHAALRRLVSGVLGCAEAGEAEGGRGEASVHSFAAAMAHVLYRCPTASAKLDHIKTLLSEMDIPIDSFHRMVFKMLPSIAFYSISLEAHAQLACFQHRYLSLSEAADGELLGAQVTKDRTGATRACPPSGLTDSACFSVFALALQQLVSLANCQPTEADVFHMLQSPMGREESAKALVDSLFDVLDSVDTIMTPAGTAAGGEAEEGGRIVPLPWVSVTTTRRWLLGLSSFIRFLGEEATLIAAKLPAMLQDCTEDPLLLECVCDVWWTLLHVCKPHYLVDHAPDIVVDLVSLYREEMGEGTAFQLLLSSLKFLCDATRDQTFWQAYFVIVVKTNKLIKALSDLVNGEAMVRQSMSATRRQSRRQSPSLQPKRHSTDNLGHPQQQQKQPPHTGGRDDAELMAERRETVEDVITGFLSITASSSAKCKAVFVRALHDFLASADVSFRLEMGRAAAASLEVVPALLRCAREVADPHDVQCAFQCVGLIGAVAPIPLDTLPTNDTVARMLPPHHLSETSSRQSYYLTLPLVLEWRKLAEILLAEHCPRALANTADPRMHDHAAYAVQELLRIYTQKERRDNSGALLREEDNVSVDELARYVWWANLDAHTQNMLSGFTTTRYTTIVRHHADRQTPVYRRGMSFEHWVFAFFHSLTQRCVGSFASVVKALRNVAKRDSHTLLFLLHMTVAQFLDSGDEEVWGDILAECKAIFDAAAAAVPGGPASGAPAAAETNATPGSQQHVRMSLRADSAMEMRTGDERVLNAHKPRVPPVDEHVQCLLHLLEDIHQLQWALAEMGRPPLPEDPSVSRSEKDLDMGSLNALRLEACYQEFLDKVPWWDCARAAIDVGSHVRALRSIERQRELPKVADAIEAVPLQRILAALNDRESANAIHNLSRGLDPADAAFSLENTGEWQLAMQHCELVLQHYPRSINHQLTYLRCMRQLGQLHMMSRYAEKMLEEAQRRVRAARRDEEAEGLLAQFSGPQRRDPSTRRVGRHRRLTRHMDAEGAAVPEEWSVSVLQNYANEAAWRLGEWDRVSTDASLPVSLAGPVACLMSNVLLRDRHQPPQQHSQHPPEGCALRGATAVGCASPFAAVCEAASRERAKLTALIRSACREGYTQAYPLVAMLHALSDVELVAEMFCTGAARATRSGGAANALVSERERTELLTGVVATLKARLELVDATLEAREPILSLHRSIYRALGLAKEVSDTWIRNARLLKDGNFPDAALSAARQSNFYASATNSNAEYYVLTTELLHSMDRTAQAIEFSQAYAADRTLSEPLRAKLQIRLTNMMEDIGSQTPTEVEAAYLKAIALDPSSEEAHHSLALFYDRLYTLRAQHLDMKRQTVAATDNVSQHRIMMDLVTAIETFAYKAAHHFGLALLRGAETVSISLPRLLTLWLDSTEALQGIRAAGYISPDNRSISKMNALVESLVLHQDVNQRIPARILMTQLSLLQSRLGHACPEVVRVLTRIIVQLMVAFPQQTLWSVLSIAYSPSDEGGRRTVTERDIICPYRDFSPDAKATLSIAMKLFKALIDFCRANPDLFGKSQQTQLRKMPFMKDVIDALERGATFLVPTVNNLTPNICAGDDADVFVSTPTLAGFQDRVRVLSSMQKPKRISFHTREGDVVSYLAKSKDEPRKDIRTMEVAFLMNTIFLKNPDARRKHFSLLRYCIAPLTHDCAIIEWVSNISTLRDVANQSYRLAGKGVPMEQLKMLAHQLKNGKITRREMMEKKVLPQTPPVLHQWFDRTFRMNQEWYQARTLFTQSTALWSMVGHVVGLGDRHCENLSLGVFTGEMMHVDFAALFDYGETLQVPERVRFRLTQNIVDAMGVLGADGPFRANCEIALRCQQDNRKAVMSIVETLVHDPLVEWQRQERSRSSVTVAVSAKQRMDRVSRRLDGYLDFFGQQPDATALNVEGQVTKLISHAAAPENLNEMYTWWMPWI